MRLLKHRSFQVLVLVLLYVFTASSLPLAVHQAFYTLSLFIKDLLLWMLPVTVGFFIAHAIASFEKRAPLFILILFLFEGLSNGASVWYAFGCGHVASSYLPTIEHHPLSDAFSALWRLGLAKPSWWSADKGTIAGILVGMVASFHVPGVERFVARGKQAAEWVLTRVFSRLIPLFVLGFVARMYQTKVLEQMIGHYRDLLLWLVFFLVLYIGGLVFLGSGRSRFLQHMKNLMPAAGVAFSSGCSLSTMPWTIEGCSKNLDNPDLAKAVIPATTNIQQIGDCIANTFLCFLIYRHFYGHAPDLMTWFSFSFVFVLARFATAAVLGGAIFIMIPIYEAYLGFNAEMVALILAFNVILDPLITCTNVVANGALCRVFERAWGLVVRKPVVIDRLP